MFSVFFFSDIEMPFTGKEKAFKHWTLNMTLRIVSTHLEFDIIWMRIIQVTCNLYQFFWNTLISNFLKHPVYSFDYNLFLL